MKGGLTDRLARWMLLKRLVCLETGCLTLVDKEERLTFGDRTEARNLCATITVSDHRFFRSIVFGGSVGAAEAYMAGHWDCDDLTVLMRIVVLNEHLLLDIEGGLALLAAPLRRMYHCKNRNTRAGSRGNIEAHYDLGNDFYALFLDGTMTYSCAIFERPETTLAKASIAKYDRICENLNLRETDHVLEIGMGWGGFAIHAASRYGCRVTATTISPSQYDWAEDDIRKRGLEDRISLLLEDYRDLSGQFDKLVSIEMIEAVGHHYLDAFFRKCARLLRPDGMMALQAITITDQKYEAHKKDVDFIKRYIFPGSTLTSVTALCLSATRVTDLKLYHLEDITVHYARTLREWRERFFNNIDKVRALGFSERFIRMWEYYLCYCEGAFAERYIGDVQALFVKPGYRPGVVISPFA
jgi:cyclopropane-fatty-acyl-phospholipid synthase